MNEHELGESPAEYAARKQVPYVQAIRELRWAEMQRQADRRQAEQDAGITVAILDGWLHHLVEIEADAEPEHIVSALDAYANAVMVARKSVLVRHQLRLLWRTLRSPAGEPRIRA